MCTCIYRRALATIPVYPQCLISCKKVHKMHKQTTVLLLFLFIIWGMSPISNSKAFQATFLRQRNFFFLMQCIEFNASGFPLVTRAKSMCLMRLGSRRGDTPEYFEIKHGKNSQVAISDQIHGLCWASLEHSTRQQHQKTKITMHKTWHYQNASFHDAAGKFSTN